ncbi:peptidylprolyl isomerase [Streptomyces palmae]|uniref:Peptidylprolyl isomerase n=1 Tax=Streptomyces palmae TaxID=1701085 RepID=A0A4Z0HEX1_9ACTN|nr:peptidylprolyl isomerase [Streptomyces palmae]TGB12982.1 peptidylprolyl isomerase [Streptomyces palmae]
MVSNEQRRRQLAREKAERQQQRREAAQRKARRRNVVIATGLALVLAAGVTAAAAGALGGDGGKSDGGGPTEPAEQPTPTEKPEPSMTIDKKARYTMDLRTDRGDVAIAMDAAKTPHTVNSFQHLAAKGFFDDTTCHRLTTENIYVLQCGDPQGDGRGGPGYTLPDENLDGLGKPGADGRVTYPAGTVAMANRNAPHTAGSQFFLVYKDSKLPPAFTPFGKMDADGLKAVRAVAAAGVKGGKPDGAPQQAVTVEKAVVEKD